jgi:hypothetical protein
MLLIEQCSVGQPVGALAIICLWVLLTWLTYAYEILCHDDVVPGEFLLVQCACQLFFWTGHINSCMFMINYLIVISSSGMLAMFDIGSGPSKHWQKLWCYDGFTVILGGIAALLIIARPLVSF